MVPIEYQLDKVRAASEKRTAKIVSVYGKHLDGQFRLYKQYEWIYDHIDRGHN